MIAEEKKIAKLEAKISRLTQDNQEMLRNLKSDYYDFHYIKDCIKYENINKATSACVLAKSAIKKYVRRK